MAVRHDADRSLVRHDADRRLVLNARILWTFSSAYRRYGDQEYADMARRAYGTLRRDFRDPIYGGLYWMVSPDGQPAETKKQITKLENKRDNDILLA